MSRLILIRHGQIEANVKQLWHGTTDSPLSKPFQKNVPKGKLFNSEFVASRLLTIVASATIDGQASYLDWQGKEIPW